MVERLVDLWTMEADAICITTNGFVKANGECVMGRGCALEAKRKFPHVSKLLGTKIKENGNHTQILMAPKDVVYVAFPVKHNWWEPADYRLIQRSAEELVKLADEHGWKQVALPRPGCGNGGLRWDEVKPFLTCLDDRFIIVHKEGK
jgi:O-acetyl-ADP-ribose deacetylase (regulator of RNase III)